MDFGMDFWNEHFARDIPPKYWFTQISIFKFTLARRPLFRSDFHATYLFIPGGRIGAQYSGGENCSQYCCNIVARIGAILLPPIGGACRCLSLLFMASSP